MRARVPVKWLAVTEATGRLEGCGPQLQPEDNPNTRRSHPGSFTINHLRTRPDGTARFTHKLPGVGQIDGLETAWLDNLARDASADGPRRTR